MKSVFSITTSSAPDMCPPYPQRDHKNATKWVGVSDKKDHRIKRVVLCLCWDGHVEDPYEMSMALGGRP